MAGLGGLPGQYGRLWHVSGLLGESTFPWLHDKNEQFDTTLVFTRRECDTSGVYPLAATRAFGLYRGYNFYKLRKLLNR